MSELFEQKATAALGGIVDIQKYLVGMQAPAESLAERICKSDRMQEFKSGRADRVKIELQPSEIKTAVTSDHTQNHWASGISRLGVGYGARRKLFLRDLMQQASTSEGAVEYPIATLTPGAAVQRGGSPELYENVTMGESTSTFALSFEPVCTIGVFQTVSKQILDDSNVLQSYLDNTLLYDTMLALENQILNGAGTPGELNGLLTAATNYTVQSPQLASEIDIIADMIEQAQVADFAPDAIVLNPVDLYSLRSKKVGASTDQYAMGDPRYQGAPSLWGLPIVVTNSIAAGTALVADFSRAAVLFEREAASVEISWQDASNFQTGMITLKCSTRVAQIIAAAGGLIKATV